MIKPTAVHAVRFLSAIAWLLTAFMTVRAISQAGLSGAGALFFGDFVHPWRGQFNLDFAWHLVFMAAWVAWRETASVKRIVFGLACIFLGGLFSFAYILAASFAPNASIRRLLVGPPLTTNKG